MWGSEVLRRKVLSGVNRLWSRRCYTGRGALWPVFHSLLTGLSSVLLKDRLNHVISTRSLGAILLTSIHMEMVN